MGGSLDYFDFEKLEKLINTREANVNNDCMFAFQDHETD